MPGEENKVKSYARPAGSILPLGPGAREERKDGIGQSGTKSRNSKSSPRAPDGTGHAVCIAPGAGAHNTRTEWNGKNGRTSERRARRRTSSVCSRSAVAGASAASSGQRMAWHGIQRVPRGDEKEVAAEQDVRAPARPEPCNGTACCWPRKQPERDKRNERSCWGRGRPDAVARTPPARVPPV